MLKAFSFSNFKFYLIAQEKILLPDYAGSTLRGGFGYAFKRAVCLIKDQECSNCLLKSRCVYSYIFKTPVPEGASRMRKYPYAPHPFVLKPPFGDKNYFDVGDTLCFELTLIGKGTYYLPYFIYTFEKLGEAGIGKSRGKFQLAKVNNLNLQNNETEVYNSSEKILHPGHHVINAESLSYHETAPAQLTLQFLTPTRIKYSGKYILDLEFHILIRNLLRRVASLSYFHCGEALELDFKAFIEKSIRINTTFRKLRWYDWQRYSTGQQTTMRLGGFVGEIGFKGELAEFVHFLRLGEHIHIGKNTAFGLGRYKLTAIN